MKSHPIFEKRRIFAPGPTPVPQEVLSALSVPTLHHRTKEFGEIMTRTRGNLQYLFQTSLPVYVLTSSGTGAMEAAVTNLFAKEDTVLVINGGKFGERWGKIAQGFGLKVETLNVEWGQAANPEEVRKRLRANPQIRGVLFQACETSTGVDHPTREIAKVTRESGEALVIVDAISALGVTPLPMDGWGIDAMVSGSQKALMLPPGLAFVAFSERAQSARARANLPRFYFDLKSEDKAVEKGQTAWTPGVSLVCALDVVLARIREIGLDPLFSHHARLAEATRRGVKALGLELLAKAAPSTSVTAVMVPQEIPEGKKVVSYLRDRFGITVAGGQDHLTGKIFRLAHLGHYDELDILTILSAVELTLTALGFPCELGKGVGAASAYFVENNL